MGAWVEQNLPTLISLLVMAGSGLMAFATLRERQSAFEKACAKEFAAVDQKVGTKFDALASTVAEVGRDVKTVVAWMNRQQGRDEGRRVGRRHDDDKQVEDVG